MIHDFKNYEDIKNFFLMACRTRNICEIILFHDQRQTVHKLLEEVTKETGRTLIDQDLSTLMPDEFSCMKFYNTAPAWLAKAMEDREGKGHIIYLREYHLSPQKVQNDVLNMMIRKCVDEASFPKNTLIVLGARKEDEAAEGLTHTHVVRFYK